MNRTEMMCLDVVKMMRHGAGIIE